MTRKVTVRQWVEALESGEYRRTDSTLCAIKVKKDGTFGQARYCCLGVLADLKGEEWTETRYSYVSDDQMRPAAPHFGDCGSAEYSGGLNEEVLDPELQSIYAEMNDAGKSFKQIAAAIRKDPNLPMSKKL